LTSWLAALDTCGLVPGETGGIAKQASRPFLCSKNTMTEPLKKKHTWKGKHQSEHQREVARATLNKLRADHPEKFNRTKKPEPPKPEVPLPKPEVPLPKPEVPSPKPEVPSPKPEVPSPKPAVAEIPIQPDTVLFGSESVPPPKIDADSPPAPPPAPPPGTPGTGAPVSAAPAPVAPPEVRKYAVMIWGLIVKICVGIFGEGFQPMTLKSDGGEVLYDEGAEGVKVWWNWLVSIGVTALSPLVELWMFMGAYFTIRFPLIIAKFKKKKPATKDSVPHVESTTPESPPENRGKPAAPERPTPPASTPSPKEQVATAAEVDTAMGEF
jgi:hypothetical protein